MTWRALEHLLHEAGYEYNPNFPDEEVPIRGSPGVWAVCVFSHPLGPDIRTIPGVSGDRYQEQMDEFHRAEFEEFKAAFPTIAALNDVLEHCA